MNTQENNKLIAEFMGYKLMSCNRGKAWDIGKSIPSKDHLFPIQGVLHTGNELAFHKSWDWLMPVVDKIESLGYEFFIVEDRIKIAHNTDHSIDTIINFTLGGSKREATYKAVVEFIKQYNK